MDISSMQRLVDKFINVNFVEYRVCELCGNPTKGYDSHINVDKTHFGTCKTCYNAVEDIAKDLFKNKRPQDIIHIDRHISCAGNYLNYWTSDLSKSQENRNLNISIQRKKIKTYNKIKNSEEYRVFCAMVMALCIWNKPEIKL